MAKLKDNVSAALGEGNSSAEGNQRASTELGGDYGRLLEALKAGRVMSFDWDLGTDVVVRSPNADEIFGCQASRSTGKAFFEQVHPEDRKRLSELIGGVTARKPDYTAAYRYVRPSDGRELVLEEAGRGVFDASGKLMRVCGVARDVTEQKRWEEALKSVALFPEENPFPVLRAGRDGRLLFANRASAGLLADWGCGVGDELPAMVLGRVRGALELGAAEVLEIGLGERRLSFVLMPIGERGYVNLYGMDVTEQKRTEEALRAKEAELEMILRRTPFMLTRCSRVFRCADTTELKGCFVHCEPGAI